MATREGQASSLQICKLPMQGSNRAVTFICSTWSSAWLKMYIHWDTLSDLPCKTANLSSTKKKKIFKLSTNGSHLHTCILSKESGTGTPAVPVQAAFMGMNRCCLVVSIGLQASSQQVTWLRYPHKTKRHSLERKSEVASPPRKCKKHLMKRLKCFA